jgi:hypothetical protein
MNTELIIMTSSAHVAGKARKFGRYRNVAVVEVEVGKRPAMISTRARGLVRIVWHSGSRSVGKTDKCQYEIALKYAKEIIENRVRD